MVEQLTLLHELAIDAIFILIERRVGHLALRLSCRDQPLGAQAVEQIKKKAGVDWNAQKPRTRLSVMSFTHSSVRPRSPLPG